MNQFFYKGIIVTTRTGSSGLRYESLLLPSGHLITGHSAVLIVYVTTLLVDLRNLPLVLQTLSRALPVFLV
jgi:hypothetical protein